jgi:beta-galactosidase
VGYATEVDDFQFRIRYSTKGSDLEKTSKIISTTNPGLIFIPLAETSDSYSFQLQRIKDNYFHSEWSPVYEVLPEQNLYPAVPRIMGVTLQRGQAMVHFESVPKAIGYQLEYREIGKKESPWKTMSSSKALEAFMFVKDLNPKSGYDFRIAAITLEGRSGFSNTIQK